MSPIQTIHFNDVDVAKQLKSTEMVWVLTDGRGLPNMAKQVLLPKQLFKSLTKICK